jgi:hypothetical protein
MNDPMLVNDDGSGGWMWAYGDRACSGDWFRMWPPGVALARTSCGWTGRIGGLLLSQELDGMGRAEQSRAEQSLVSGIGGGWVRPEGIPTVCLGVCGNRLCDIIIHVSGQIVIVCVMNPWGMANVGLFPPSPIDLTTISHTILVLGK